MSRMLKGDAILRALAMVEKTEVREKSTRPKIG